MIIPTQLIQVTGTIDTASAVGMANYVVYQVFLCHTLQLNVSVKNAAIKICSARVIFENELQTLLVPLLKAECFLLLKCSVILVFRALFAQALASCFKDPFSPIKYSGY